MKIAKIVKQRLHLTIYPNYKNSLRPFTVFYHINYVVQVFTQPLDSYMRNMKRPKGICYVMHAQSHYKRHYQVSPKTTLSKTIPLSNKLTPIQSLTKGSVTFCKNKFPNIIRINVKTEGLDNFLRPTIPEFWKFF